MIFTESTIKISNNVSKMDSTIVLYRGDKNVEIRFTILQSPFKYSNTVATNIIESTNASFGQLVIKTPNDKPPIFSDVSATKEGTVLFTITKEMIDEIEEVGAYTFQIRLLDENKQSRVTIPPVENGIEIKEPIAIEDDNSTNVVGLAKANYAVATLSDVDTPTFDDNGKYNKTNWNDGDIITNTSLNKIEDGIYTTNENVTATKKYVDDKVTVKILPVDYNKNYATNVADLEPNSIYMSPNDAKFLYLAYEKLSGSLVGFLFTAKAHGRFIYTGAKDDTKIEIMMEGSCYTVYFKTDTVDGHVEKTVFYLTKNNTTEFIPSNDYEPATKKYVDDNTPIKSLPVNPTTKTAATVDVNNITSSGCYALPKRADGTQWTNLRMRAIVNDGSGNSKVLLLTGYQNFVFHVNIESKKIYCDNLRIVYNIGTTADTTYIDTEPYYLPTTNTKEYTPTNDYNPVTKKYVDDKIKTDLGTSELTTTAKDIKGAVNELNTQYKDIAKKGTPQQFGAKADGVTDDTNAINLALQNLDYVVFNGNYLISDDILMKKNQTIHFNNKSSLILKQSATLKINYRCVVENIIFKYPDNCKINKPAIGIYSDYIKTVDDTNLNIKLSNIEILSKFNSTINDNTINAIEVKLNTENNISGWLVYFNDIFIQGDFKDAINLSIDGNKDEFIWFNDIEFNDIKIIGSINGIVFNPKTFQGATRQNVFENIKMDNVSMQYIKNKSDKIIKINGGNDYYLNNITPWDWSGESIYINNDLVYRIFIDRFNYKDILIDKQNLPNKERQVYILNSKEGYSQGWISDVIDIFKTNYTLGELYNIPNGRYTINPDKNHIAFLKNLFLPEPSYGATFTIIEYYKGYKRIEIQYSTFNAVQIKNNIKNQLGLICILDFPNSGEVFDWKNANITRDNWVIFRCTEGEGSDGLNKNSSLTINDSTQQRFNLIYTDGFAGVNIGGWDYFNKNNYGGFELGNFYDISTLSFRSKTAKDENSWTSWRKILTDKYSPNGPTKSRPTDIGKGCCYFDTDINKPIWWNGTNWVDSAGTIV